MHKLIKNRLFFVVSGVLLLAIAGFSFFLVTPESSRGPDSVPPSDQDGRADRTGAWIDEVVFIMQPDSGQVVKQIESGHFDLYAGGITNPTIYNRIRQSNQVEYALSFGSSVELTMNTAEFKDESRLNPFQERKIRQAMNWLLDRDYIAAEIFGGLAAPRYLPISTVLPDYARLAQPARALELQYSHDHQRAERIINRGLTELGAEKKAGKWFYQGEPIELKILIRTEDARRQMGDYVANLLIRLGFEVQRMYRTAAEASRIWIAADPAGGGWHLYTGGWMSTVINRDLAGELDQFYTPRGRPEPLWQSYDPQPELDKLAERLRRRDYDTWEERQAMMARGMELAMEESTRAWVLDQKSVWAHAANVEFAADLAAGFGGSALWPYTLRFTDRIGGRMKIGIPGLLTEPWNPIAGTNWIFDRMITRSLNDSAVLPDPYTGLFRPQRIEKAEVTVKTDIPVQKTLDWVELKRKPEIQVPKDAWIDWNHEQQRFISVGEKEPEKITARTRTRVVYDEDYMARTWHDGASASVADIVLPWILFFERADEKSPLFDPAAMPVFQSFATHFRGWRIVSESPLEIEIYSDQIFPDAEWIAGARTPGSSAWHVLAVGIMTEREGRLAFSSDKADQTGVEWMNLISGPSLSILDRELSRARAESFIPFAETLGEYIDKEEAAARYQALADWRRQKGHYWVGDGPLYLHSARPVEKTVVLRRFREFPDPADKWLRFDKPEIPELKLEGPQLVEQGGQVEFDLSIQFDGEPYPEKALENVGFMIFDCYDHLVIEGEAVRDEQKKGKWLITLTGETTEQLETGASSLEVAVTSQLVALPSFASFSFAVIPGNDSSD